MLQKCPWLIDYATPYAVLKIMCMPESENTGWLNSPTSRAYLLENTTAINELCYGMFSLTLLLQMTLMKSRLF